MTKINFGNRAHWNMFTADKKELIDVYNNIVERFGLNEEMIHLMHSGQEFRYSVGQDGAILLWYYPKDIEEENKNCAKTCFQYKIDLYKDKGMIQPRFMIHFDEPAFYDSTAEFGKTIVVKNKKLIMTITQRMSVFDNTDDVYKALIDWHDKVRKDALKARIEAI